MRIAITGSSSINHINLSEYIPEELAHNVEIVLGGSSKIDICAKEFAIKNNLKLTEFIPDFDIEDVSLALEHYSKIISNSDLVVIFWDGKSKNSKQIVDCCEKILKPYKVILI